MTAPIAFGLTAVFVAVLLLLERLPSVHRAAYGVVKLSASATFVLYGVVVVLRDGVIELPDVPLFGALLLSFLGDALLVPRGHKAVFLGGLLAFLLGHCAYVGAFVLRGVDPLAFAAAGVVAVFAAIGVMRWLRPHLRGVMRVAVPAYVAVIGAMVCASVAAVVAAGHGPRAAPGALLIAGTCCFWVSDLAVARERFVADGYVNRVVGIPLYFFAQLLILEGWQPGR